MLIDNGTIISYISNADSIVDGFDLISNLI